jgi:hypothetical protein
MMRNTRSASARIELGGGLQGLVDLAENIPHQRLQLQRSLGGGHAVAGAHQQGVVERFPQTPQAIAHRGLGQIQLVGGLSDVAFAQQHVQVDQEVEVDAMNIH